VAVVVTDLDPERVLNLDLGSAEFKQNWREHMAAWAVRDPFYIVNGDAPVVVICSRYAHVHEVYMDNERFSTSVPRRPGYEMFDKFMGVRLLAQMDGEAHDRVRRLLNPAFSPKGVARLEDGVRQVVTARLDEIEDGGTEFDGMADLGAQLIVDVMLKVLLGLTPEQRAVFQEMHRVIPLVTYTRPGEAYPEVCVTAFANAREMINELIETKRQAPQEGDFISAMVMARDNEDKLNDVELFDQIFTVCAGALSGTTLAFGGILYSFFKHPDQLQEIKDDPQLLLPAMEEAMRWNKCGYLTFPRFALVDLEIGGTPIYEGMVVRVSPQAAHYDPDKYPDPLTFDIHRNPKDVIIFGGGRHFCLGHRLARMSMRIAVEELLARFPNARLADLDYEPTYAGSVGELRIESLPMVIG
jgi:cytochrome P450